jgi:hypothetical protein
MLFFLIERKATLHADDVATERTRSIVEQLLPVPHSI